MSKNSSFPTHPPSEALPLFALLFGVFKRGVSPSFRKTFPLSFSRRGGLRG
jgi:hypothetical protein